MIASAVIVSSAQSSVKRARERRAQKVRHLKRSVSTNNLHHQHALHEHCATSQQPQMQTDGQSIISNERQWSIHNCAGGLVNRHNRTREPLDMRSSPGSFACARSAVRGYAATRSSIFHAPFSSTNMTLVFKVSLKFSAEIVAVIGMTTEALSVFTV